MAGEPPPRETTASRSLHPILIEHPSNLDGLDTDLRDASGAVVAVACATCHESGSETALAERQGVPSDFHAAIELRHGTLRCNSCHAPSDRTRLRLADGRLLAMRDVMVLCGQCHGPQYRDYQHGSHGGARGYWDLRRGPRTRNSCVACHGAHRPAYPTVLPAPGPNDRFLPRPSAQEGETASHD